MEQGTVKWFNETKGFGFISREGANDIFVHHTGIVSEGFRSLREGATVEFQVEESDKGPRAVQVREI